MESPSFTSRAFFYPNGGCMLDQDLKQQLQGVFSTLENQIELVYTSSNHEDQNQLVELLTDVAQTSGKISLKNDSSTSLAPEFSISINQKKSGVTFKGIPNGHEFTSLIVAILNADGKGKLPDASIIKRIQSLKGPIRIQTYISLTCENCPDVVQALNLMAFLHPDFKHEMLDGAYFQDDIAKLNIQGVPSVIVNNKLLHSGRITFIDLLAKVEAEFGLDESKAQTMKAPVDLGQLDVAVIGGGPAGASAAIYSVRKGLKTALICERFGGQVQDTKGIENLIGVVYTEGPQLADQLNKHLMSYPVQLLEHRRVEKIDKDNRTIYFTSGEFVKAKSIIVATGAKWRELNIPGEKDYMGRGVAYCPHCDGPYYKGKKVAVIGGGNSGVEAAIDLSGIVSEVVLFEYNDSLKADQVLVDKLKSIPNARIITSAKTLSVIGDGTKVTALDYQDRKTEKTVTENLDGIFVQIGLLPNSQFIKDIVETNKFGEIVVDVKGRTSVKGIYAAGDVTTTPFKQIIIAMGEGAKAALAAFEDSMYGGHS
jgi:alkyl hydroperoxide reductase subunit F